MRIKKIKYQGIEYDSKLEAVWSVFMNQALVFAGNLLPHPKYLQDITNWIPDFLYLTPAGNNILIDVKGIRKASEWHNPKTIKYKAYRDALVSSKKRILASQWNNSDYQLLIVGYKLRFDRDTLMLSEKKCIVPFGLLYEPADNVHGYTYSPVTFIKHVYFIPDDDRYGSFDLNVYHFAKVDGTECLVCGEIINEYNYLTLKDEKSISSVFNRIGDYFEKNTYLNE